MKKLLAMTLLVITCCALMLSGCGPSKEELAAQAAAVKDQKAFDNAKEAYTELCKAADATISVMDSVYGAWYFGIYKSKDSSTSSVLDDIAKETKLTKSELEEAVDSLSLELNAESSTLLYILANNQDNKDLKSWQLCLFVVNEAYKLNGVFDEIQNNIKLANSSLKTMTAEYDDYKHYPALKQFYSEVSSYAEFAQSPTGSFQQLKDTIIDYENKIRTYRSDLTFVFD